MSLIKEYLRLSKEAAAKYGPKTFLLMQVGAFYECYGEIANRATITTSAARASWPVPTRRPASSWPASGITAWKSI
jgi:DNA mismatch repair ATPase MutS